MAISDLDLSIRIEDCLTQRNLRGMRQIQTALEPGYCLRGARLLNHARQHVFIGTGFPVAGTFETDGPVGAITLYRVLESFGALPIIVCAPPLVDMLESDFRTLSLDTGADINNTDTAAAALAHYQPSLVISIERPGLSQDNRYHNMRGEDITPHCGCFDHFLNLATCPTLAIGDGGNEIGMGNVSEALAQLNIIPAQTQCDELIIADVSNWAAYGLIAFLAYWQDKDLLADINPLETLNYLSSLGSVDGVTRINQLTEDGLDWQEGQDVINQLRHLTGFTAT